jgi:hypothetical protein
MYLHYVVGERSFPHSELSDYTPIYRWRFEFTGQYTGISNKRSDIIKYIQTEIRTLRGLLESLCHVKGGT